MAISFVASTRSPTSFPGSTNNTSTCTINKPTGTAQNDLMIAFLESGGGTGGEATAPAGWTELGGTFLHQNSTANMTLTVFYRVAGASEGASYAFGDGQAGTTPLCGQILTYRGVDTSAPISDSTSAETTGTTAASAPTLTSTAVGWYLWYRAGKTATVASEGNFTITSGTSRGKTSNRGGSTQYFCQTADSAADQTIGSHTGASFSSSLTLTGSIEATLVLKAAITNVSGADTGSGSDTAVVSASAGDSGSGADAAAVSAQLTAADTGAGADDGAALASLPAADTGSAVDDAAAAVATAVPAADTGSALQELVTNPGFETNTSGWDGNASFWSNSGATLTRITTDSHSGAACCDVVTSGALNQQGANYRPTGAANRTYVITAWVKVISGRPVRMRVRDTTNAINGVDSAFTSSAAWTQLTASITTGASTPVITLSIVTDTTAGASEFYIDDVSMLWTSDTATVVVGAADTGTGADQAAGFGQDTGSVADSAIVLTPVSDTGSGVDNAAATNTAQDGDTASGVDAATLRQYAAETAAGVDSAAVVAAIPATDTGSGVDAGGQLQTTGDTGSAADAATVRQYVADTGSGVDSASPPLAVVFGADTGSGSEGTPNITVGDGDAAGAGVDFAIQGIVGAVSAGRVYIAEADPNQRCKYVLADEDDHRTYTADSDPEVTK